MKKLGEVAEIVGGGTPSTSVEEYWKGSIPWISSSDISEKSISIINKTRFINEKAIKETATKLIPKGAILLVSRVGIGKFAIADENLCTSQDFSNLITTQNSYFLASYFQSKVNKFLNLSQGTSIKGFTTKDIKFIKFSFPKLEEQTKIANFLTKLDEKIQVQREIIEELEKLIKGYRQKLFLQELRFKDENGKDFPDWEIKRLKEICKKKSSNISANSLEEVTGQYKIYGANGVLKNINFYQEDTPYVAIVKDGAGVGRTIVCEEKTSVLGTLDKILPLHNNSLYFLYLLLNKIKFEKYIVGSTIPHIYFKDYSKEKIELPSLKEQTKIANFLSSLDKKLKTEQELLSAYEQQKKYFLQNMFV